MVILEHISYRLDRYFFSEFEGRRRTNREEEYRQVFMDSVLNHRQYQNNDSNSGLLKFRTAPNSMLANFTNGIYKGSDSFEIFSNSRPSSHEIQGLTSGFNPSEDNSNSILQSFPDLEEGKPLANGYSSQLPPHYPRQSSATQLAAMDGPYKVVGSMAMDHQRAGKLGSNLMRQRSSPAGLFSHFPVQNGYAAMRGVGNYKVGKGSNGDVSPSSSKLRGQMSFSSKIPSSLGMMSQISEIESEFIGTNGHDDGKLGDDKMGTQFHSSGYSLSSWNDSTHFTENFTGLKRDLDNDGKLFAGGIQNGEIGNHTHILSHHLTLPRTSAEMADVEKLLQFQDAVPCKIRAKRGCATHPRSIAERMRRTRISERMRKLQELVPNMDKQTNTADMLDFAVEYIKELQKQFKMLSENRAKCKCSSIQKPIPNQTV